MIDESTHILHPEIQDSSPSTNEESWIENELRPPSLEEYIGQDAIKSNLYYFLEAAKSRQESLDHVLLHGPPGLGKTSLALVLAKEMNANIKITSGPAIEKTGDLAALLTHLQEGDFLFIDEIHQLKKPIEELLYSAMEDFALDIMIGKGAGARNLRLKLPPFTLVGASTKISKISRPLRERFGNILKLEFYSESELAQIIQRSSGILGTYIHPKAAHLLAKSSRGTPRIANRILKRVRDFTQVKGLLEIQETQVLSSLEMLGIDPLGLDNFDLKILKCIHDHFHGGPVGVSTLSAALHEEAETIEDVHEPYLMQLGFLQRTPKGRIITENGIIYLHQHL